MLVFGDRTTLTEPRPQLLGLAASLTEITCETAAASRHDALVSALIQAGELAQGLADAEFEATGEDSLTPLHLSALALAAQLGRDVAASWRGASSFVGAPAQEAIADLLALPLPDQIACRTGEGFAHYAVYPEAYILAVLSRVWRGRPLMIGVRSIGVPLAAAAAAELGGGLVSLRPTGEPFRRKVRAGADVRSLVRRHGGPIGVADEGPGLSGSSLGAVGDLLAELGVAEERIVYLPSHAGEPGDRAAPEQRTRWRRAHRSPATLERVLEKRPIAAWFKDLTGPVLQIEDLSAGAWRTDLPRHAWPPAWRWQERRKFRLTTSEGRFVARFAGLGETGRRKLLRAQTLASAGFTPEPLALRSGFLLERWIEGAPCAAPPESRPRFLERLGLYLGFRARRFPASADAGANDDALLEMTLVNAQRLCGRELSNATSRRWASFRHAPASALVAVDGRLHVWEWRGDAQGRIWKTDALDHCEAHDLVGCQDIAWDVAGAAVEYSLDAFEIERLRRMTGEAAGRVVHPARLGRSLLAYCAFQAGVWSFAAEDQQEAERAAARVDFYAVKLRRLAQGDGFD